MRPVSIELKRATEKYDIIIGHNNLKDLGKHLATLKIGNAAVVITNPVIREHHGEALTLGLQEHGFEVDMIDVPSGEVSKSAEVAFNLIEQIAQKHAGKDIFLIAFGGGVVGDLVGYVAAAYKRGIPYVQVPTTFLAQIDSAIGGKVAIDLPFGKNLVGAFYHPRVVFTDVSLLQTLDERQVHAGLAEAVKYGVICDRNLFDLIEKNIDALLKLEEKILTEVIFQCSRIKASIVSRDEKEDKGLRVILNFGHTAGHAIEAACAYEEYNHGEAVALGMRIAAEISLQLGLVKQEPVQRLDDMLTLIGLPDKIAGLTLDTIMDRMRHDKKFKSGKNRFVLMSSIGTVKVQQDIDEQIIKNAIDKYILSDDRSRSVSFESSTIEPKSYSEKNAEMDLFSNQNDVPDSNLSTDFSSPFKDWDPGSNNENTPFRQ